MKLPKLEGIQQFSLNKSVHDVFTEFKGRRAAIIKALTSDYRQFYMMCDPAKDNLCLYGLPDERWCVSSPCEKVPPFTPEPVTGINFARDGMSESQWRTFVATHSDAWLVASAFHLGGIYRFNKLQRDQLFDMINDLPTVPVVVDEFEKLSEAKKLAASTPNQGSSSSKPNEKEKEEEDGNSDGGGSGGGGGGDDDEDYWCGICEKIYKEDQFWIYCDVCRNWFHGKCVSVTATQAKEISTYTCPLCSS